MKRRVKYPNCRVAADEVVAADLRGVMTSGCRVKEAKVVVEVAEVWVVEWAA